MSGIHPTPADQARDDITFAVATAYMRLSREVRGQVIAYLAGPRNPVGAHEVAQLVVAATQSEDLVLVLARLLVAVPDDEAMEAMVNLVPAQPAATTCTESQVHPRRRASDVVGG